MELYTKIIKYKPNQIYGYVSELVNLNKLNHENIIKYIDYIIKLDCIYITFPKINYTLRFMIKNKNK